MPDYPPEDLFAEYNAIVWKTYDTLSALAAFESFWQETERLVADAADVSEKNETFELGSGDPATDFFERRRIGRHLHDEVVTPTFRYATVITLFAVIERELKRFADTLAKEESHPLGYRDLKGGLFEQLSRYTEVYRGSCVLKLRRIRRPLSRPSTRHETIPLRFSNRFTENVG